MVHLLVRLRVFVLGRWGGNGAFVCAGVLIRSQYIELCKCTLHDDIELSDDGVACLYHNQLECTYRDEGADAGPVGR